MIGPEVCVAGSELCECVTGLSKCGRIRCGRTSSVCVAGRVGCVVGLGKCGRISSVRVCVAGCAGCVAGLGKCGRISSVHVWQDVLGVWQD